MSTSPSHEQRQAVRTHYGEIARAERSGCGTAESGCCGPSSSTALGYSAAELSALPEGADLGLGCGNPTGIAALQPGETVLDLGSGAGIDCFLAAQAVGPEGRVIGVDMTPDMVERARANALNAGVSNVEFRLGEIESLPVADASVDVILSNCVVNLSTDKPRVWREAHRVLRPGGRVAVSDMVAVGELPAAVRDDPASYSGCVSGAVGVEEIRGMLAAAGFGEIDVTLAGAAAGPVRSATIHAVRGR
jgi:SAM-dependent methyltransferase